MGDRLRLRHCGVIEVSVVCQLDAACRAMADLRIRDNGCGIPPEALGSFLERGYFSSDGAAAWPRIDWCQSSVAKLGGKLSVESDGPDRGATLHVLLPLAVPAASSENDQVLEASQAEPLAEQV